MRSKNVVVELQGGLGNQLFGWAAGYALSKKLNCELVLDTSKLYQRGYQLRAFEFGDNTRILKGSEALTTNLVKLSRRNVFRESGFHFNPEFSALSEPVVLCGYFQSWRYHRGAKYEIYSMARKLSVESCALTDLRNRLDLKNLIAVHVRRGDYKELEDFHGTIKSDYYFQALRRIKDLTRENRKYVVFSDEPIEAEKVVPDAVAYIGPDTLPSPAENMILMSEFQSLIGANSSFSLWAAMLMKSPDQIKIFPKPWFSHNSFDESDLMPSHFMRLELKKC